MLRSTFFDTRDPHGNFGAEERTRRANRRRLTVFLIVFALFSLVGLIYDYSRPPIYEATARLNLVPATGQRTNDPARPGEQANFLRDEVQFLTSRTLLAEAWERLKGAPVPPPAVSLVDPAASLQTMLSVTPVEGTNVVSMRARGGEPTFLKAFVDRLVAAYQVSVTQRYKIASVDAVVEVRDEARKLEESVAAKRREADAFRARYNIVSLERDENQILSEVKGAGAALNAANDKVVAAEARLGALKEAQEAGQSVTRNKDNPTLAALEQQAAGIRADLKEVARTFTPQYMQIDPRVRSQRERLVEIEQQIVAQRQTSQQGALQEAREELAGARAAAARLRQQLAANQQSVQSFTSRFNEYRGMQDELARVQQLRQKAVERLAALEAEESARVPKVELVESATTPTSPVSPLYARDAALVLGGALLVALLAMGIVELFNRPPPQPATVIVPQTWMPMPLGGHASAAIGMELPRALLDVAARPPASLPAPPILPRELTTGEHRALFDVADRDLRAAIALLSTGLTAQEVVQLCCGDIDRDAGVAKVTGAAQRQLSIPPNVLALLPDDGQSSDSPVVTARNGAPMSEADLDAALLYAAHDAAIEHADEVTANSIHHTYVAYLVRQGVRFSELVKLVGDLRADLLAAYGKMTPAGPRQSIEHVDRVLPVMRE